MTLQYHYIVPGDDFVHAGEASGHLKGVLRQLGYPGDAIRRVAVSMYEGEINMVIHANGGEIDAEIDDRGITIVLRDQGPGIPDVEKAMQELELRAEKDRCQEPEAFTDNVIMYEVLSELKDIAARGGVSCTCGCREYSIAVHRGSVDLICKSCGGKLRLPAATDEDLDRLCCQMKLVIHGV